MKRVGQLLVMLCLFGMPACLGVDCCCYPAHDVSMRIVGAEDDPERWLVTIEGRSGPGERPDDLGRVVLRVPALRDCRTYRLGLFLEENGPLYETLVHVWRDGLVVRAVRLADIEDLPLDAFGYRVVELDL